MRISTRGRYGLRLMLDLALNNNGEYIPLKMIAKRQDISDKYLEQIIHLLSKAGFVQSARGIKGGYRLTKKPEEYTVGEILRLVEGSLAPVACLEYDTPCNNVDSCITIGLYRKLQEAINAVVDNTTLADMMIDKTFCCKSKQK
ncbi:MAG: Rrf2 family transcriptional regulator [Acidaminococcaceae bacterium]|nr:Rrf2 family transcriptional regulator [Acidaminococcaceae bacterium]